MAPRQAKTMEETKAEVAKYGAEIETSINEFQSEEIDEKSDKELTAYLQKLKKREAEIQQKYGKFIDAVEILKKEKDAITEEEANYWQQVTDKRDSILITLQIDKEMVVEMQGERKKVRMEQNDIAEKRRIAQEEIERKRCIEDEELERKRRMEDEELAERKAYIKANGKPACNEWKK